MDYVRICYVRSIPLCLPVTSAAMLFVITNIKTPVMAGVRTTTYMDHSLLLGFLGDYHILDLIVDRLGDDLL